MALRSMRYLHYLVLAALVAVPLLAAGCSRVPHADREGRGCCDQES